ncbi:MAG: Uncharacterized protein AWU57_620 [Marinobacter sp. T13-3]|nr:MAG: Uncharacterized protein AWU57_620 [Marinobacter sp. T13-3]
MTDAPTPIAIYTPDGPNLYRITFDPQAAQDAHAQGCETITDHSMTDLLLEMAPRPASEYMDAQTWQALAPALKEAAEQLISETNPVHAPVGLGLPPVSPDFPAPLLPDRMDTLARVFDARTDAETWVDLQELAFARQAGREVNVEILSDDARGSSWDTVYDESTDDLHEQQADLQAAWTENPRIAAIRDLEVRELYYALDTHPETELDSAMAPG